MTANYHTPLATGAALNASVLNSPLSQLDSAMSSLTSGSEAIDQLNLGVETELTIASGVITVTLSRHQIDTEGDAATDELTQINGGAIGDVLYLRSVSSARVPTLTHDATKIFLAGRQNLTLDSEYMVVELQCIATSPNCLWVQVNEPLVLSAGAHNTTLRYFRDLAVKPSFAVRNSFEVKAAAATIAFSGVATPTATGTPSASNDTDSTYINLLSGASSGNITGYVAATFNLVRRQHNPKFSIVIRTGAAADIANIRYWIGLCSSAPTNVDTFAGVLSFAGFRYSTVIGDAGFVPVTCDGTTQNVGAMVTNGGIVASTRYLLSMQINDSAGTAVFSINNGATTTLSANLPAAGTELGYAFYLITTAAVAKNFKFSRMVVEYD
jgi:hypothetical protein